jgi:hypothetical protein
MKKPASVTIIISAAVASLTALLIVFWPGKLTQAEFEQKVRGDSNIRTLKLEDGLAAVELEDQLSHRVQVDTGVKIAKHFSAWRQSSGFGPHVKVEVTCSGSTIGVNYTNGSALSFYIPGASTTDQGQ